MRKYILAPAIAIVIICTFALVSGTGRVVDTGPTQRYEEPESFRAACDGLFEEFGWQCRGINPPIVMTTVLVDWASNYGWLGVTIEQEDAIYLSPRVTPDRRKEIVLHETVHYIMQRLGVSRELGTCENERIARKISGGTWDEDDKRSYGCNTPEEGEKK